MSTFRFNSTPIDGCYEVLSPRFEDQRGSFEELYHADVFNEVRIGPWFLQTNLSRSKGHVLRGLHLQKTNPQGKLVRCISGRIYDVCLDIRRDSKTFGMWCAFVLDESRALYLPPGTAHGFYAYVDSVVMYQCTTLYNKSSDGGVLWNDPDLGIAWPCKDPIISEKDSHLPTLKQYLQLEKR